MLAADGRLSAERVWRSRKQRQGQRERLRNAGPIPSERRCQVVVDVLSLQLKAPSHWEPIPEPRRMGVAECEDAANYNGAVETVGVTRAI